MAVTVRDLLKLDIMKDFKVEAGAGGLDRSISTTEILDFEFLKEGEEYRGKSFEGDSIVLTSLLFAKDHPEQIRDAIQKLHYLNVHCMAYKPVIFRQLPEDALAYADQTGLVILKFGNDEFFEDIIFAVKELTRKTGELEQIEPLVEEMLKRPFGSAEMAETAELMNPLFRPYLTAYCINDSKADAETMLHKIKFINLPEKLKRVAFVCRCRDRYLLILSTDEEDSLELQEMLDSVLTCYGVKKTGAVIGISSTTRLADGIDRCIAQAYWSQVVAEIEKTDVKYYRELGIYKLFVPWPGTRAASEFMEGYLMPLISESGNDEELLETAICYVLADGDMNVAAERMFCHKNTIRYRVGKLQERLDPDSGEKVFFQNLSAAVKIYLLKKNS